MSLEIFQEGGPLNIKRTGHEHYSLRVSLAEGDVLAKAKAAIKWCETASKADQQKPWAYKLIPDDAVIRTNDFKFTIAQAVTVI